VALANVGVDDHLAGRQARQGATCNHNPPATGLTSLGKSVKGKQLHKLATLLNIKLIMFCATIMKKYPSTETVALQCIIWELLSLTMAFQ
jgi:hypothetical protein